MNSKHPSAEPFTFEALATRSINYLQQLVDAEGLPYFDVFWTNPAEAAHDWPDAGDVMTRQLEAAVMLRHMTGTAVGTEKRWRQELLEMIDLGDGQAHRPARPWCRAVVEDAALPLGALNALAIDGDDEALRAACRMAEGYLRRLRETEAAIHAFSGFAIKALMVTARMLRCDAALEAAGLLVDRFFRKGRTITPDNKFGPRTHTHGMLKSLVGAADYALTVGDAVLYSRIDALYRHMKTLGTRFGFIPEVINWRTSDMIACETCALMDFAGLGVTLANHGHAEYWGDMERLARNHLTESQIRDASWLASDGARSDAPQFTWRQIEQRIVGAWAGWSSPNHVLAYRETLNAHWGGPELRDKIRFLQNCCGGSGVHALFILWKNSSRFADGTLSVNLHIDKRLPEAEIRCQQPYCGLTRITLARDCALRVRVPEFTSAVEIRVTVNGQSREIAGRTTGGGSLLGDSRLDERPGIFGNYIELSAVKAGDRIEVAYPLPVTTEEVAVGNPGYRQWHYRVTWKGDTVVRIEPVGNEVKTAWSDFDKMQREVFYGEDGPGPLYQRQHMLSDIEPAESAINRDNSALDLWHISKR